MRYTKQDINFLKENYPKYGASYCAPILNRDSSVIYAQAQRLGLKKVSNQKHPSLMNVNHEKFLKENISYIEAYFLGLFWADGNIIHYTSKNIEHYKIALEISYDDIIEVKPLFDKIGNWAFSSRKRKETWKKTGILTTNNKYLYELFKSLDFDKKSGKSPCLLLSYIPSSLHNYFFRGYFDGDGSIFFKNYNGGFHNSIKFTSCIDQDWSFMQDLFEKINATYGINKYTHPTKKHKSSKIYMQSKQSVLKFIQYIYSGEKIGFSRKYSTCKKFVDLVSHSF